MSEPSKTEMPAKTLEALQASIRKWAKYTAASEVPELGPGSCPLCLMFHESYGGRRDDSCKGCPVRDASGLSGCINTPYGSAEAAMAVWYDEPDNVFLRGEFRRAAVDEYDFLVSLLPDGVKPEVE